MKNLIIFVLLLAIYACSNFRQPNSGPDIRLEEMLIQLPVRDKSVLLGAGDGNALHAIEIYGIPEVKITHGSMGVVGESQATSFPSPLAMACTWNKNLAFEQGVQLGKEAKDSGYGILFAPSVNLYRLPQYGRNFENYGEDPCLTSALTVPIIRGIQSQHVISAVQYAGCYNQEYNHNINNIVIDERSLHELYLYPFKQAIQEARAGAIVMAPNMLNQRHCSENQVLIRDIIRRQYGFDGIVFTDYYSSYSPQIIAAGIDIELPEARYMDYPYIRSLIAHGQISIGDIDKKIENIVTTHQRLHAYTPATREMESSERDRHAVTARQIARESLVLLKNTGQVLPLSNLEGKSIAVFSSHKQQLPLSGAGKVYSEYWKPDDLTAILRQKTKQQGTTVDAFSLEPGKENILSTIEYYQPGTALPGVEMKVFDAANFSETPLATQITPHIEAVFENYPEVEDDEYWVEWTAGVMPEETGEYTFLLETNNQCNVYLDNQILMLGFERKPALVQQENVQLNSNREYTLRIVQKMNKNSSIRFGYKKKQSVEIDQIASLARKYDYAIVCAGFDAYTEGEGRDRPFEIPVHQRNLIRAVAGNNANTVVLVTAGGSVEMSSWINNVQGLLYASYLGVSGAGAFAEVLLGEVSPSGRLPFTIERQWADAAAYYSYDTAEANAAPTILHMDHKPKPYETIEYAEGIYSGYRHFDRNDIKPLFPFGYGLSYTSFHYESIILSSESMDENGQINVTVTVKNTGEIAGYETVQLYIRDIEASEERPVKELKDFEKFMLQPGEIKKINFDIDKEKLAYFSPQQNEWVTEPGEFLILVGASADHIKLTKSFKLK